MILYYLFSFFIAIGDKLSSVFGTAYNLPYGLDSILVTAVSYFRGAIDTLPYLSVVLDFFLYAVAFELVLLTLKLIFGSRTPVNLN